MRSEEETQKEMDGLCKERDMNSCGIVNDLCQCSGVWKKNMCRGLVVVVDWFARTIF